MITVAIIEANRMVRDSMTDMLNALPDVSVLHASDAPVFDTLKVLAPRLLLLSIGLPNEQCVDIASRARDELSACDVIVMDLAPAQNCIAQLVNIGAAGFILKDATFDEYVDTIRLVAVGGSVMPPRMIGSLFSQMALATVAARKSDRIDAVHLTRREREVIGLIAQVKSNKETAMQLCIAAQTPKWRS